MTASESNGCEIRDDDNAECALPLETVKRYSLAGVGFGPPGTECIVYFRRVRCPVGHSYDQETASVEMPVDEEDRA
jgi:hypothetical protein